MKPTPLELLVRLAREGGVHVPISTSTVTLAEELDVSQQTASRWMVDLEDEGLLERSPGPRGQRVRLTDDGLGVLQELHQDLEDVFGGPQDVMLRGNVATGDGEGAWYIGLPHYTSAFEHLLGWKPFPGTLNLEVSGADLRTMEGLKRRKGMEVVKFSTDERTFGGVTCFPALVRELDAAIIFPHRTRHTNVVEVISPFGLRDKLGLKDGDPLSVQADARPPRKSYRPDTS